MSKLWVRLTAAFTLVTVVVIGILLSAGYLVATSRFQQYVESRFGSLPTSVGNQLTAYYRQWGTWEGVELLLEDDFPLALADTVLADADGLVVFDSTGETTGQQMSDEEREDLRSLAEGDQVVGYWQISLPASFLPGSPEHNLLFGLQRLLLFGALLATVMGLVVSGVLTRSLTTPLQRLVAASQAVASGDLSQRVAEQGSREVVEVARAFNEMTAELEEAETLRENLMADVAHELRTPLSVLQGNLRAILDDVYPLEKAEIARLYDETRLLNRLVDDLRELAQAEAGQLSLNVRSTDVHELIHSTAANFGPAVESKGVELSVDVAGDLPAIQSDPDRLAQVLRNLLVNALNHTPAGGQISISATCVENAIRIAVTDSGEGIPTEDRERIFDRFWRADPSRCRENGGSGLGLAIARSLVEAHGGRIWAESSPGQGAGLFLELPVP